MTFEELRKLDRATPFRPFANILASGRKVRADHPEFTALSPDEDVIVVFEADGHLTIDAPLTYGLKEFRNGARKRKR